MMRILFVVLLLFPSLVWAEGERRILSLVPSLTECIYTLGAEDQLVGVTDYCRFPEEATLKPKTGGLLDPNLELMLALRPTVVFHMPTKRNTEQTLERAGIKMVPIPSERLSDIPLALRTIGAELNIKDRSEEAVSLFESEIEAISAQAEGLSRPRVLLVIGRPPGAVRTVFSAGRENFLDDLLTAVGAENRLKDTKVPYPEVSIESLIGDPPDVIIETRSGDLDFDEKMKERARQEWAAVFRDPKKPVRVEFLHDPHLTVPGPGIVESARRLQLLVHPSLGQADE